MSPSRIVLFGFIFLFGLSQPTNLTAQSYALAPDSAIILNITGTSTLHGWTVVANSIQDVPENIDLSGEETQQINHFSFGVVIDSLDGGRGASMNAKIKKALQASEHPIITYQQTDTATFTKVDADGNFKLLSKGILNMVGMEKTIEIEVIGQKTAEGIVLKGSKPLKFSEFDIEPPSAMFGQIVCGDDIAVNFEFRYSVK